MGQRGPMPKRSSERTRNNKAGEDGIELKKGIALEWSWVKADKEWPAFIRDYYNSFQHTGMSAYYQQTDIQQLYMACHILAEQFKTARPSAIMVGEAFKLLDGLGATEGERRRMKIELDKPKEETDEEANQKIAAVTSIHDRLQRSADGA